jgi:ABC-2 type transport system permease protein
VSALHAEWTKLRSVRGTAWALLGIVASTLAIGVVSASTSHPDVVPNEDVVMIALAGVYLAQVAAVAFGVVAICGEYTTGKSGRRSPPTPGGARWWSRRRRSSERS